MFGSTCDVSRMSHAEFHVSGVSVMCECQVSAGLGGCIVETPSLLWAITRFKRPREEPLVVVVVVVRALTSNYLRLAPQNLGKYCYVTVLLVRERPRTVTTFTGGRLRAMHIPSAPMMRAVLPPSVDAVSTLTLPTAARAFSLGFSLELFPTTTSMSRSCFLETHASRDHLRR